MMLLLLLVVEVLYAPVHFEKDGDKCIFNSFIYLRHEHESHRMLEAIAKQLKEEVCSLVLHCYHLCNTESVLYIKKIKKTSNFKKVLLKFTFCEF